MGQPKNHKSQAKPALTNESPAITGPSHHLHWTSAEMAWHAATRRASGMRPCASHASTAMRGGTDMRRAADRAARTCDLGTRTQW
jgi:hypothetical protein